MLFLQFKRTLFRRALFFTHTESVVCVVQVWQVGFQEQLHNSQPVQEMSY